MHKRFFIVKSDVLLFISMTLICCLIGSYGAIEKPSYIRKYSKGYSGNHYSSQKVVEGVKLRNPNYVRQRLNDYLNIKEQGVLDEDLYKKHLSIHFNNSMLFATFISIMMSSLFVMLRRNRREYFEETCFMLLLIIKNYIHRVDGEWEEYSLNHSF